MAKHRAIIIGAGRMGSGWGLTEKSHYYVHAKTYKDLADRVELVGFVEPDKDRAAWAAERWKLPAFYSLDIIQEEEVDIVSVCTPPENHPHTVDWLTEHCESVKGIWVEKPFMVKGEYYRQHPPFIQVNYCRRFDRFHQKTKIFLKDATKIRLVVMAKKDVHTVCHMTDLARWWNADNFDYVDTPDEPGAYFLRYKLKDRLWAEQTFPSGGLVGDEFMKNALANLLDAVEGKAELLSPPENAIKSEEWANRILEGKA